MVTYRKLQHGIKEIRLLKILPPGPSFTPLGPLDFAASPIRCELQYESLDTIRSRTNGRDGAQNSILDYLLQGIPQRGSNEEGRDNAAVMDLARREMRQLLMTDKESSYDLGAERKEALSSLHPLFEKTMKEWLPAGLQVRPLAFKQWLGSWIWTPLSNDEHYLESKSLGYFALSYVWMDHQESSLSNKGRYKEMEQMVRASGVSSRQALDGELSTDILDQLFGRNDEAAANTTEIEIDGMPTRVGKNLEKALRALREIPEIQNGTRVWVDALCINQNDVLEKNVEVKRMGEIYKHAERVVSWLGDEKDYSGETLEFMSTVGQALNSTAAAAPIVIGFFENLKADAALGMTRLLLRSYWSRIWIVQEITMGGDKSTVICGARRFAMHDLLRCGKLLRAGLGSGLLNRHLRLDTDSETDFLTLGDFQTGITKLNTLHDVKTNCREESQELPASNTLWFRIPSSCNATDSRDLVYGMLNLLPRKLTELIDVDYSEDNKFVDVMTNFATAHIKSTNSLYWILHRPFAPFLGHAEWPSWVPNLALPYSSAHWSWPSQASQAGPNTPPTFTFSKDVATGKPLLFCKGVYIDTINEATQSIVMDRLEKARELAQYCMDSFNSEPSEETYSLIEDIQDKMVTLQSSFIADTTEDEEFTEMPTSVTESKYRDLSGLKSALTDCFNHLGLSFESGYTLFDIPHDLGASDEIDTQQLQSSSLINIPEAIIVEQLREVLNCFKLWGRSFSDFFPAHLADVGADSFSLPQIKDRTVTLGRLFTTCGGYVGTCLGSVRPGDKLFFLYGCHMPVILRRSTTCPGAYSLQGGAYVAGLDWSQLQDVIDETISIC